MTIRPYPTTPLDRASDDELRAELAAREVDRQQIPGRRTKPDLQPLCDYIYQVMVEHKETKQSSAEEHHKHEVFALVLEAFYGNEVWDWWYRIIPPKGNQP